MQWHPSGITLFRSIMNGLPGVVLVFLLTCSVGVIRGEESSFEDDEDGFLPKAETIESKPSSINVTGPDDEKRDVVPEEMPDDPELEPPSDTTVPVIPADEVPLIDDFLPPNPPDVVPMGGNRSESGLSDDESPFRGEDDPGLTDPGSRDPGLRDPGLRDPRPTGTNRPPFPGDAPRSRPYGDEFPVRPERGRDSAPASDAVGDSPSGGATEEADYSRCQFAYSYKGPFGVFHLTNKGGSAHYRTLDGKRFLSMLAPPSHSNPQQTIDLPVCCKKFIYFIPEPGCGDSSIIAWAFSREPCGPNGYVAMKHTGGKWQIHSWCRRDVVCDSCFPPPQPPPHPCPPIGCSPCWPIWCCRPCFGGIIHPIYPPPCYSGSCGFGPAPMNMGGAMNGYGTGDDF